MIIKRIKLIEYPEQSEDYLNPKFNLITSNNINSVGKSTYCRLLFYALGYPVPSTENIKFEKIKTELTILEGKKEFSIMRDSNILSIKSADNSFSQEYNLPNEHTAFLSFLFEVNSPLISKNLLGLMYIDQEKGWTLLNRGKVIGGIRFSIDELISALKGTNCDDLFAKRNALEESVEKYQSLLKMNSIKEEYYENNNNLNLLSLSEDLRRRMASLQLAIQEIKKDINDITSVIKQDTTFFSYIESMNLYVRNGDDLIKITKDNIENSCSVEYLKAQKAILESRLNKLNNEKIELQKEIENVETIPDLLGENKIVDTEKKINHVLSSVNIDIENIKLVLENVKEELETVKKQIRDRLRRENEYIKQVYELFVEYAKELNVEKTIAQKEDYIFTDNLKCRTGANFQKLIIAYKIAVLKVVENVINKKLIFVVDSPKAKELDDVNTKQIMDFLKDKLSENQVIIASIYSEDGLYTSFDKIITLNGKAIEKR